MKVAYFTDQTLSSKATDLIQFDVDSLRQVVAGEHGQEPTIWLANPDQYERDGRILRDSTSPRLLAYSRKDKTLYVTDGCNSCAHHLIDELQKLTAEQRRVFSKESSIRLDLIEKLVTNLTAN